MVIQCDTPIAVWGWNDPCCEVQVVLGDERTSCTSDAKGAWSCRLGALPAGLELELRVSSGTEAITRTGILTGEVWFCSGQSNMAHGVGQTNQLPEALQDADHPGIRFFAVKDAQDVEAQADCQGSWSDCTPESVPSLSSVAFHFARDVHQETRVPVGMIVCAVGNTSILQWLSREALESAGDFSEILAASRMPAVGPHTDPGIGEKSAHWHESEFDDAGWRTVALPAEWSDLGFDFNGAVWFRRKFDLPEDLTGRACELSLGILNDFDVTYVNGTRVGLTDASTPQWWDAPRYYQVPASVLRAHDNVIAIRLFDQWEDGWIKEAAGHRMRLSSPDVPGIEVLLRGEWRCEIESCLPMRGVKTAQPCGHFHAMVAPLTRFPVRGLLWYQGESDVENPERYRALFPALIGDWRRLWGQGDLPFLFVQLPKYARPMHHPSRGRTADLRESQEAALSLPNTGMAVTLDLGEADDIHPNNKRDVGLRLSRIALNRVYRLAREDCGPQYVGMSVLGNRVFVRLSHADGLHAQGVIEGFEVAGKDSRFWPARAWMEAAAVVVECADVLEPVAVRYAWSDNPPHPLYNGVGLAAGPFRSDAFMTKA